MDVSGGEDKLTKAFTSLKIPANAVHAAPCEGYKDMRSVSALN